MEIERNCFNERYTKIVSDLGDIARENLVLDCMYMFPFLTEKKDCAFRMLSDIFYHMFLLCRPIPFWLGRNTGFKSYRQEVFAKFPRTGIPSYFSSVADLDTYINLLIKTKTIDTAKKIWWDLRIHPVYPTIEFRICDMPFTIEETVCIAAIIQSLVAKIYKMHRQNISFREYRRIFIAENKWRAGKDGIDAHLIDLGKEENVSYEDLLEELIDFVDDVVDDLGCREEVAYAREIIRMGTGADRQLEVFKQTGDLKKVVDYMIEQTEKEIIHA